MKPLQEKAYESLRELLIKGDYLPGTLLSENELAQLLEMSRTPVRSAISRLEAEGYLETVKNRGILVKEITIKEFLDIMEVIISFQHYQFHHMDEKLLQIDVELLKHHLDQQLECTAQHDYIGYSTHSISFLRTMISGTSNQAMLQIIDGFFDKILRFSIVNFKRTPHKPHYSANSMNKEIYEAVSIEDYQKVRQLINQFHENILERFSIG